MSAGTPADTPLPPLGQRQLFVYWRVAGDDLVAALQALRHWHAALRSDLPALQCTLYQRHDHATSQVTVMEAYAIALPGAGIGPQLLQRITHDGDILLRRWLVGARHVEVFDACDAGG